MNNTQLSNGARRILRLIILLLLIAVGITSYSTRATNQQQESVEQTIAPLVAERNETCSLETLQQSINNFNCIYFLLSPKSPQTPLDQTYYIPSASLEILDASLFNNPTLHLEENWIRKEAAEPLKTLVQDAKNNGLTLSPYSAYRTIDAQNAYKNSLKTSIGRDENQTGFGVDFISQSNAGTLFQKEFKDTQDGIWLIENAYKYGFILRYPLGKESVTHVDFSPWHFRYVGVDVATEMREKNLAFEEWLTAKGVTFQQ